jgi:hypothetical protein
LRAIEKGSGQIHESNRQYRKDEVLNSFPYFSAYCSPNIRGRGMRYVAAAYFA